MPLKNIRITDPYGCSCDVIAKKISEWIVIIICITIAAIIKNTSQWHMQCVPGIDSQCGEYTAFPDPGLAYPSKSSTISYGLVNTLCPITWLLIVVLNVLIINCYHSILHSKDKQLYRIVLIKCEILVRSAFLSAAASSLTTDILKSAVGRPRPNYLSNEELNESSRSFPSGHTSYMFAVFFLLTLYLFHSLLSVQKLIYAHKQIKQIITANETYVIKMDKMINVSNGDAYLCVSLFVFLRNIPLVSAMIALLPTFVAIIVACSRLTDYKHHYSDVLAGCMIGVAYACVSFKLYKSEFYYGYKYDIDTIVTNEVLTDDNKEIVEL